MSEGKMISWVERALFVKFGVMTVLILGLAFATPAAQFVKAGAHKICQATLMKGSARPGCPIT